MIASRRLGWLGVALTVSTLLAFGCGSSSSGPDSNSTDLPDVTGTYTGSWERLESVPSCSAPGSIDITGQSGEQINGTFTIDGNGECFRGTISGTVEGEHDEFFGNTGNEVWFVLTFKSGDAEDLFEVITGCVTSQVNTQPIGAFLPETGRLRLNSAATASASMDCGGTGGFVVVIDGEFRRE